MSSVTQRSLVGLMITLRMATASQAEVIVNDSRSDYVINASTPVELSQALRRANHQTEQGLTEVALTTSRLSVQMRAKGHQAGCRIDSVTITADIEIRMPTLQTQSDYLKYQWRAYYPKLLEHEMQHRAITLDQAHKIEQEILALPDQNTCEDMMADAEYTFEQLNQDSQRQQRLFDEAEYASGYLNLKHFFKLQQR